MPQLCQCEHADHFPGELPSHDPQGNCTDPNPEVGAHRYGAACEGVLPTRTLYGLFDLCPACRAHLKDYLLAAQPAGHPDTGPVCEHGFIGACSACDGSGQDPELELEPDGPAAVVPGCPPGHEPDWASHGLLRAPGERATAYLARWARTVEEIADGWAHHSRHALTPRGRKRLAALWLLGFAGTEFPTAYTAQGSYLAWEAGLRFRVGTLGLAPRPGAVEPELVAI